MKRSCVYMLMLIAPPSFADDRPTIHLLHPHNDRLNSIAQTNTIADIPGYDHYLQPPNGGSRHIWLHKRTLIRHSDIKGIDYNIEDGTVLMTLSIGGMRAVHSSSRNTTRLSIGFVDKGHLITTAEVDLQAICRPEELKLIFPSSEELQTIKIKLNKVPNKPRISSDCESSSGR